MSVTMAAHGFAFLFFLLPSGQGSTPTHDEDVVTQVVFIPDQGATFIESIPVAPPQPVAPRKEATAQKTAPVTEKAPENPSPVQEVGEEPMESKMLTMVANEEEMSALDLPAPEHPPTEILSYRKAYQPVYPPEARLAGDSGWVTLRVLIDAEGQPLTFIVVNSTATDRLIEAAINAVKQWRFNPATSKGQQVAAWIEVPIGFWNSRTTAR